jgi:cytochrome c-type biogenesis protein
MSGVSLSIAFVGGGLATLNPCGFPLLPAFLSFYVGADEARLPSAPTRAAQGLAAGMLLTAGFLGVFAVVGLPISLGLGAIAPAIPWLGIGIGATLVLAGLGSVAGVRIAVPTHVGSRVPHARRWTATLTFGAAYGMASLGCTLPIFLALLGASLTSTGPGGTLAVFAAYGLGMAVVLTALAVGGALLREGLAGRLRSLLPYAARIAGTLLVVSGGYLVYYWARIRFGSAATLADDPIVGMVTRYSARLQSYAAGQGRLFFAGAGVVVAIASVATITRSIRSRRRSSSTAAVVGR